MLPSPTDFGLTQTSSQYNELINLVTGPDRPDPGIKTTNGQYQYLINILSDRQDIAHGIAKRSNKLDTFWLHVATELNRIGPPTKNPIAWRKVWSDYKSYVKKKLIQNKTEIEVTDGKPRKLNFLSSLEQKVVRISGLEKFIKLVDGNVLISFEENRLGATDSSKESLDIDLLCLETEDLKGNPKKNSNCKEEPDDSSFDDEDSIEKLLRDTSESFENIKDSELDQSLYITKSNINKIKANEIEKSLNTTKSYILRQNDALQDVINCVKRKESNFKNFDYNLKKLYRGLYRAYIVQKCSLREMIRHNREVEKIMRKRLRIKEQVLEMKKTQRKQSNRRRQF